MTDSERQQILKMIEEGKITAEEGLKLMNALGEQPDDNPPALPDAESAPEVMVMGEPFRDEKTDDSGKKERDAAFERKMNRYRRLWVIPLWIGVAVTVAGAYWMYSILNSSGMNFWFFCSWLPFLMGVGVLALAFSSRTSRWIYINVHEKKSGKSPVHIVLAFPLSMVSWIVTTFKGSVPEKERGVVDDVMNAVEGSTRSDGPLLVEVDEGDEQVQVYIG